MEHLLSAWPEVIKQLQNARHILLLLDYDGTLTPIVESPELANLSEVNRQLLKALARQDNFTIGIISGRSLVDLRNKVRISNVIYAGNHGLEIEGPGIRFVNHLAQELKPILRIMHYSLSQALRTIKGAWVENKELSLSVHYRLVNEKRTGEVKDIFERVVGDTQALGRVKITSGKKVIEVRPAIAWDKGKAIKMLMKRYGKGGQKSGLLTIYIGDDQTDEDGFKVVEDHECGISVLVGKQNHHSAARYFSESPAEVAKFLSLLLDQAQQGFK